MLEEPHLGQLGDISTIGFHPLSMSNGILRENPDGDWHLTKLYKFISEKDEIFVMGF